MNPVFRFSICVLMMSSVLCGMDKLVPPEGFELVHHITGKPLPRDINDAGQGDTRNQRATRDIFWSTMEQWKNYQNERQPHVQDGGLALDTSIVRTDGFLPFESSSPTPSSSLISDVLQRQFDRAQKQVPEITDNDPSTRRLNLKTDSTIPEEAFEMVQKRTGHTLPDDANNSPATRALFLHMFPEYRKGTASTVHTSLSTPPTLPPIQAPKLAQLAHGAPGSPRTPPAVNVQSDLSQKRGKRRRVQKDLRKDLEKKPAKRQKKASDSHIGLPPMARHVFAQAASVVHSQKNRRTLGISDSE